MPRVSRNPGSVWLTIGAALSFAAALMHVCVIAGGPDWYRFFGAPESYAQAAARGSAMPAIVTTGIASVLAIWAALALSGAGLIARLPLLRFALIAITSVYLLRGLLIIPAFLYVPYPEGAFDYWSSAIVLVYGMVHALGLWLAWPELSSSRGAAS